MVDYFFEVGMTELSTDPFPAVRLHTWRNILCKLFIDPSFGSGQMDEFDRSRAVTWSY